MSTQALPATGGKFIFGRISRREGGWWVKAHKDVHRISNALGL